MSKFVTIHKIDENGCRTSATYELIGSREDVLRHAVMQGFFKRFDWWSEFYKNKCAALKINKLPHSLIWNEFDVYFQVLLEEYDK